MLEACHPYGDHGYVKICLKWDSPIIEYVGEIRKTSSIKKVVSSWYGQNHHHQQDQVECTANIFSW
jgi:hypothetical protein